MPANGSCNAASDMEGSAYNGGALCHPGPALVPLEWMAPGLAGEWGVVVEVTVAQTQSVNRTYWPESGPQTRLQGSLGSGGHSSWDIFHKIYWGQDV